jgi:hypothetical protein
MKTIQRISPKSLARLLGLMYAVFGFIAGLIMMLVALVSQASEPGVIGIVFGVAAPIFLTLLYGIMGWVGGYVAAWVYNLLAKRVGGIQLEIE